MPSSEWIGIAAGRIRRYLARQNGGTLPSTVPEWRELCEEIGVPAGRLFDCPPEFTARLLRDERMRDGWVIVYNERATAGNVCRYLCHEISEWLALRDVPEAFRELPHFAYDYTGGGDSEAASHLIARRVEELCFRR